MLRAQVAAEGHNVSASTAGERDAIRQYVESLDPARFAQLSQPSGEAAGGL